MVSYLICNGPLIRPTLFSNKYYYCHEIDEKMIAGYCRLCYVCQIRVYIHKDGTNVCSRNTDVLVFTLGLKRIKAFGLAYRLNGSHL